MLPKWSLSHLFSSRPHLSIFLMTFVVGSSTSLASQLASTISEHVWSNSHASLNLNGFVTDWNSRPAISIYSGLWSEESNLRWWAFVPANLKSQSLVAKARSSLSFIEWPVEKCFCHVYQEPTKPRSIKPHSSATFRNNCICVWFLLLPPNFSELLIKIPGTQPRDIKFSVKLLKLIPWLNPFMRHRFTIKACETPYLLLPFIDDGIYMIWWERFNMQVDWISPKEC